MASITRRLSRWQWLDNFTKSPFASFGGFRDLFVGPKQPKPARREPGPLSTWVLPTQGLTNLLAEARTKSEARAIFKRQLGGPIPKGTKIKLLKEAYA